MTSRDFSGRDVVKALTKNRFTIVGRTGSHVKLRYDHPTNDDDVRVVTVPQHDRIRIGTLRNIAEQSGAEDFEEWCRWIDRHC
ncbi:type II toxin-antitoxin system HicA family toxin [Halorubrum vacuolatum]|uniref:Predicted RNA binding protein YcfA, dsRBD-like fold, HicA-like mRNA interferase family n=1 Tax=Halorubrum vacuolatum TaxID=63740 RepID=A0A238Y3R7_HALVU|nr:type II toxin-antitoxin system HicA family toxin [Halorubrum vacuolatum]SNR65855.1 Predicted RNA binding protein YcfA, dsRBD-like fold, HicA-like mRNA interferase family [Halorubrum vacuolatum]